MTTITTYAKYKIIMDGEHRITVHMRDDGIKMVCRKSWSANSFSEQDVEDIRRAVNFTYGYSKDIHSTTMTGGEQLTVKAL